MYIEVIVCNVSVIFLRHSVVIKHSKVTNNCYCHIYPKQNSLAKVV